MGRRCDGTKAPKQGASCDGLRRSREPYQKRTSAPLLSSIRSSRREYLLYRSSLFIRASGFSPLPFHFPSLFPSTSLPLCMGGPTIPTNLPGHADGDKPGGRGSDHTHHHTGRTRVADDRHSHHYPEATTRSLVSALAASPPADQMRFC